MSIINTSLLQGTKILSKKGGQIKVKKMPKFKSLKEERNFWDTHSVADYLSELKKTGEIVFERRPLKRNFQMRLDDTTINKLKKLAKAKGVDVSTLIRRWIREHLDKELKTA